ncbi:MFS transporter [Futiania mangrovi]|uniref:MFS transporter n=1 Tax=Futiania mangrovi TaxID=2959716 RepID=A0A9J6P9R9_9PROT|nr:MFS transporter [Futiania mangrovii]MCP1336732.1 MFS transporter [Futiania mangrovii]
MTADVPAAGVGRPPGGLPLTLAAVTGVQALATLAVLALATVAPTAADSFTVGAEMVGYQVSLIYVSAALMSAIAGPLVRRWGPGAASIFALAMSCVGILGIASGNLAVVVVASLLLGVGYGLTNPSSSSILQRVTPPARRNLVFSLKQTGVPLGGILAGLMLPPLTEAIGWQAAFVVSGGLIVLLLVLLLPLRARWDEEREPQRPLRGTMLSGLALVWRQPELRALSFMGFCFATTQLCLMAFTVTMLVQELHWSLVAAGGLISLVQACGAGGRVIWGMLADRLRFGIPVLILIGLLSAAACLVTAFLGPDWPPAAVVAVLCVFGASSIGWNGVFLADVARLTRREDVGLATGGALFFTFGGVVVGPALYSALYKLIGSYTLTFGAVAVFPLAGALVLLALLRRTRRT